MASAQALEWQASMGRGLASMSKHDVYELVPAPKERKNMVQCGCLRLSLTFFSSLDSVHKVFLT